VEGWHTNQTVIKPLDKPGVQNGLVSFEQTHLKDDEWEAANDDTGPHPNLSKTKNVITCNAIKQELSSSKRM
jgi:hypothetical protein